jgi:hypothetical protein
MLTNGSTAIEWSVGMAAAVGGVVARAAIGVGALVL